MIQNIINLFKTKIPIKYFNNVEEIKFIEVGDWIDLRCAQKTIIDGVLGTKPKSKITPTLIPLGIAVHLPKGYEAIIAPRGSTFKNFNILQVNSPGIVDESYKGDNDQWFMPVIALTDVVIEKGERICQFRIQKKMKKHRFMFKQVDKLDNDDRGGHGSTGTR